MNKSFTLIEILVVIVVIGILSSFILVGMSSITDKANITKSQAFLNSLDNSLLTSRVSQWKLDNASGASVSDSWLTNTGTLVNFTDTTAGYGDNHDSGWMSQFNCVSGTCLRFNGVNNYITIVDNNSLQFGYNPFTFSLWFKVNGNSSTGTEGLINKYDSVQGYWGLYYNYSSRTMQFATRSSDNNEIINFSPTQTLNYNNWYNITWAINDTSHTVYVNGKFLQNFNDTRVTREYSPDSGLRLGNFNGHYLNGLLDDVRLYNTIISAHQIKQSYYLGINRLFINNLSDIMEYNNRIVELKQSLVDNN